MQEFRYKVAASGEMLDSRYTDATVAEGETHPLQAVEVIVRGPMTPERVQKALADALVAYRSDPDNPRNSHLFVTPAE